MKTEVCGEIRLSDFEPAPDNFKAEFIAGLKRHPKILPCKLFYDEHSHGFSTKSVSSMSII